MDSSRMRNLLRWKYFAHHHPNDIRNAKIGEKCESDKRTQREVRNVF